MTHFFSNSLPNDKQLFDCPTCCGLGYIQQSYHVYYTWDGAKYCTDTIVCPRCHGSKTIDY